MSHPCKDPACPRDLEAGAAECSRCGHRAVSIKPADLDPLTGRFAAGPELVLGQRFRLIRKLGVGGMGEVWLAEDSRLHLRVACKVIKPELAGDRRALLNFRREVGLNLRLAHDSIVRIHDYHEMDRIHFIAMEYVEGSSLDHALTDRLERKEGGYPLDDVLRLLEPVAGALDYAHGRGVFHRDVKPANILLASDGTTKLADFGIARAATDATIRQTGQAASYTLLYVSPEQQMGKCAPASDQYSLAATAYELLSGAPPFHSGDIAAQIQLIMPDPIEGLAPALNSLLLRGLSKRPEDRFESCMAFVDALKGKDPARASMPAPAISPANSLSARRDGMAVEPVAGERREFRLAAGVTMSFIWIPPGEFAMGSPESEASRFSDERQHLVRITRGFWLGQFPVTQAQWNAVMKDAPPPNDGMGIPFLRGWRSREVRPHFTGDTLPMESVTWAESQRFLTAASGTDGGRYRLPTEAEWEYACRAGSATAYCFGDSRAQLEEYGWYKSNSDAKTHPVGMKLPNAWGLHDMHGNVWEWCSDWYGANYYANSPAADPQGPGSGANRVLRGGSWNRSANRCRSASRDNFTPAFRVNILGFRVVRTAD